MLAQRHDPQKVVRDDWRRRGQWPPSAPTPTLSSFEMSVLRTGAQGVAQRTLIPRLHFEVRVPMPYRQRRKGRAGMSVPNTTEVASAHASPMIPGAREPGSLTRFAVRPEMSQPIVDVTIDAATLAERRREGGGTARKRYRARVLPLTPLMWRIRAMWRIRRTPPPLVAVREPVAVEPGR